MNITQQQAQQNAQIAVGLARHVLAQNEPRQSFAAAIRTAANNANREGGKVRVAFRDLTASSGPGGGYLVATSTGPAVLDALRDGHFLREVGVTFYEDLQENLAVPTVKTGIAGGWVGAETGAITAGNPVFGSVSLTPKRACGFVAYSHQLSLQVNASEQVLRTQLREGITAILEAAVIGGSGASGQPTGIINTPGVGTQSGSSLSYAGLRAMRKAVLLAGAAERNLTWIGAPDTQETLGGRERAAGGGRFLWDDNGIMGRPAVATSYATAGSLVCGDWSRCTVGIWGDAFELEIDPYYGFNTGQLAARMTLSCDVMFHPATAFCVSTSVT